MNILLGIPMLSIYYPELVKEWECWDTSGEILQHTALISFAQLIIFLFILSWIIVDTVWNCYGVGNSTSLERFQRCAAKIVFKMDDSD